MPILRRRSLRPLAAALLGAGFVAASVAPAFSPNPAAAQVVTTQDPEVRQLLERARLTVERARSDQAFGTAPELLQRARGILVVPELIKGGFFVGGEGGRGVLLARTAEGWSDPAFVTLASASFGLQIGVQTSEVVMFVMTDAALQSLQRDNFKLGGQASLAVATLGSNVQAASSTDLNADIYVWAKAAGAFAGLTLEGTAVATDEERNRIAYGRPITGPEILAGRAGSAGPAADALKRALGG